MKRHWVLLISGLAFMIAAGVTAVLEVPGTWAVGALGVILILFSMLSGGIEKFKVSSEGIEATAARAEQIASQAYATLEHVRGLMVAVGKYLVWQKAGAGRYGGTGPQAAADGEVLLHKLMEAAGLTQDDFREIQTVLHPFMRFDYENYVTKAVPNENWSPEQRDAWTAYFAGPHRTGIGSEASPPDLRAFLTRLGFLNDEVEQRLQDYEYWDRTKEHRRPDSWRKG